MVKELAAFGASPQVLNDPSFANYRCTTYEGAKADMVTATYTGVH